MGFVSSLETLFPFRWKNLFITYHMSAFTLLLYSKFKTHWPNFGRILVWSIEKTCSNFCDLIYCLWCYFLVGKDDMNGFNKCCIYSLILLINWNACDCLGVRCWGNQEWFVIVFITMYLEFPFFLRFIVISYDLSPVRGCDHRLVSCFHNSSWPDDSLLKSRGFKDEGVF